MDEMDNRLFKMFNRILEIYVVFIEGSHNNSMDVL